MVDGFTRFISLYEWQPTWYQDRIKNILKKNKGKKAVEIISFPIDDFGTANDQKTIEFVGNVAHAIIQFGRKNKRNEEEKEEKHEKDEHKRYMHCLGGHGRTGLISSMLLQIIYGMDDEIAVKFLNEIHRMRHPYCGPNRMPESKTQREQIKRLHNRMSQIRDKLRVN